MRPAHLLQLFLIFVLAGQASGEALYYGKQSDLPPIRFIGDRDYPPIEWLEAGTPRGIFASFLEELSKSIDRPIEYSLMNWKDAQRAVLNNQGDVLTVFSPNSDRINDYDFVDSFLSLEISLFLKSDNLTINGLKDLEGLKAGVIPGSFPQKILANESQAELVLIKNHLEGFQLLLSGDIDAIATTKWVGSYVIQKNKLRGIKFLAEPVAVKTTHMGVRKGDVEMIQLLQKGVNKLETTGKLSKLNEQWSGYNMVYLTESKVRSYVYYAVVISLFVFILITFVAIFILRKQVKDRTQSLALANVELEEAFSNLVKTQKQLIETEKMAALGSIVAGVAHEINTPLGVAVTINSSLIESLKKLQAEFDNERLTQDALTKFIDQNSDALSVEEGALTKAVLLVNDFKKLLTYQNHEQRGNFDLAETLKTAVNQCHGILSEQDIATNIRGKDGIEMNSFPFPLLQVITEIISNVCSHAFNEQIHNKHLTIEFQELDQTVNIRIEDNGIGIPEEEKSKIFDPFYTSKFNTKHSGIGLSVAHSIVHHILGGEIQITSEEGAGLAVTIRVPKNAPELT